MNVRFLCAVAMAGLGFSTPLGANAAEYHVVYNGTITDGYDVDNIFGLSGQSLAGMGLRADVTYLTSVPGTRMTSVNYDEVSGGEAFGTDPVISSAVFTLGSMSFSLSPSYYGDVCTSAQYLDAYGLDLLGNSFQTYILPDNAGPRSLQTPFFSTGIGDTGGASTQYSYFIAGNDDIDFNATSVAVSAVPEAATWAMMLIGLGAIGSVLRRSKRSRRPTLSV